ncbi:pyridoxamine 5'-phosphate oxidase family protein [Mobilicoccus caccae]|uniref:Pyridoxamine 5'-phosphate oxidase n=1 Tax=Mobilicoccus caccae TaxID=1859295 RepID=A0ABQ6IYW7_9MICO|nr:pyridoxamine 5'-phosphate oxidase family protein [Mobilicoccus caccae]GMA42271.1 pyridoxamine 5'-phosphate oxidase [Mobilicoccus caccae]
MATEVASLSHEDCWDMLQREEFGRLAYSLDGEVHIVPINYAVDSGRLVFRTAEGSKLLAVLRGGTVAFEIDDIGDEWASSVIVRGPASELPPEDARWADQLRLRPWIRSEKQYVVAIQPTEMSGLRYRLHRPWTSMFPQP